MYHYLAPILLSAVSTLVATTSHPWPGDGGHQVLPLSSAVGGVASPFPVTPHPFPATPHPPWSPGVLHHLLPHFSPRWQQHRTHVFRSHSNSCVAVQLLEVASPFCSRSVSSGFHLVAEMKRWQISGVLYLDVTPVFLSLVVATPHPWPVNMLVVDFRCVASPFRSRVFHLGAAIPHTWPVKTW